MATVRSWPLLRVCITRGGGRVDDAHGEPDASVSQEIEPHVAALMPLESCPGNRLAGGEGMEWPHPGGEAQRCVIPADDLQAVLVAGRKGKWRMGCEYAVQGGAHDPISRAGEILLVT